MNIFKMELRLKRKGFWTWTIVMSIIIVVFLALFPTYKTMFEGFDELILSMPPHIINALGLSGFNFTKVLEYYAYCHQYILIAGMIYALMLGTKSLVSEESDRTIEFLYAKPVSRSRIYTEKMVSSIAIFLLFTIIQAVITGFFCVLYKEPEIASTTMILDVFRIYISFALIGIMFLGLGMFLSSIMKSSSSASSLSLGIFFLLYMLGMLSNMFESLSFLRYTAPLEYLRPRDMMNGGRVDFLYLFIASSLIGIFYSFGYLLYNNKDLKI
jgi:ABC-2 type transport system permease protein